MKKAINLTFQKKFEQNIIFLKILRFYVFIKKIFLDYF